MAESQWRVLDSVGEHAIVSEPGGDPIDGLRLREFCGWVLRCFEEVHADQMLQVAGGLVVDEVRVSRIHLCDSRIQQVGQSHVELLTWRVPDQSVRAPELSWPGTLVPGKLSCSEREMTPEANWSLGDHRSSE